MSLIWLSREDVQKSGGGDAVAAVPVLERALSVHGEGQTCQPLKPYLRIPNDELERRIIAMPSYLGNEFQTWGMKWIASCPRNPTERGMERASAVIILNDLETGRPVAMMDAGLISAVRTAAVALIGAKYCARPDSKTLGLIGSGMIGGMIATNLLKTNPSLERVRIFDHYPEAAKRLIEQIEKQSDVKCEVVESPKDAMDRADIVVAATTAQDGYIDGEWMHEGSVFLNISLRDAKFSVIERADKLIVDDWEQANRGTTPIFKMTQAGRLSREDLYAELPEIISGRLPGRERDDEIIVVNPMGLAIEDIAVAHRVYETAKMKNLGVQLPY